ncbi:hypothetical protein [Pseudomonas sp. Irchel 3E20]|uniref:hypothetical protein n=1 Tax=Pseudomonas sp. Irchel 3E20 TaxID=2008983 RepID=UPI000BA43358|nr:hypothetical protein [Pseudomonas sp. Irchel 3E20]
MEDIFIVKRCNKFRIRGRRAGEADQNAVPQDWYRVLDTRTQGFIGDGYDELADAKKECLRLNLASQHVVPR